MAKPHGYLKTLISEHRTWVNANLLKELIAHQRPDLLDLACRIRPGAVSKLVEAGPILVSSTGHPALTRACLAVLKDHGVVVSDAELEQAGPLMNPKFVSS